MDLWLQLLTVTTLSGVAAFLLILVLAPFARLPDLVDVFIGLSYNGRILLYCK
jgi:hypothetical protein